MFKFLSIFDTKAYGECIMCAKRIKKEKLYYHYENVGICHNCSKRLPYVPVGALMEGNKDISYFISVFYYMSPISKLVSDYKFNGCKSYGMIFANYMTDYIEALYEGEYDFDLIVPVPLSKEHMKERGYNQACVFAEEISKQCNIKCSEEAIVKIKNTQRQTKLTHEKRMENVRGAFKASENVVNGRNILLVDDVVTTGSTAKECAAELIKSGACSVRVFSLATKYKNNTSQAYRELFGI